MENENPTPAGEIHIEGPLDPAVDTSPTNEEIVDGTAGQEEDQTRSYKYWQGKYTESSKGAQEIATKYNSVRKEHEILQAKLNELQSERQRLAQEKEEIEKRFASEKPEDYDAILLKKEIAEIKGHLSKQAEERQMNDFLSANADAGRYKDALLNLRRVEPGKTFEQLYNQYFRAGEEAVKLAQRETQARQTQVETGSGVAVDEPVAGDIPADFEDWPLEKQKSFLSKKGWLKREMRTT